MEPDGTFETGGTSSPGRLRDAASSLQNSGGGQTLSNQMMKQMMKHQMKHKTIDETCLAQADQAALSQTCPSCHRHFKITHRDLSSSGSHFSIEYGKGSRAAWPTLSHNVSSLSWKKRRARQCKVVGLWFTYVYILCSGLWCGCFALLRHAGARASTELGSCSLRRSR